MPKVIEDNRGRLLSVDFGLSPFVPQRMFFVDFLKSEMTRGQHAHLECEQYLICVSGKFQYRVENKKEKREIDVYPGDEYYHQNLEWIEIISKEDGSSFISLCSEKYLVSDYIREYERFKELIR